MAAIRHTLQKDLFEPSDERLLAVCHVSKLPKKKKTSFLCIITSIKSPITVTICQVKQNDKNVYKKKRTWFLSEVKLIDGKNESPDTQEFDITIDRQYRWLASNLQERQNFVIVLWKQCSKHLPKEKPQFKNVPSMWLDEALNTPGHIASKKMLSKDVADAVEIADDIIETEEFQVLTEREEADLNKLMTGCDYAISNAELFIEQLSKDLCILDGENVQNILASEEQVEALMNQLESAITEAEKVEVRLDSYDEILCHIRDTMEKMEEKNSMIEVANRNNAKLQSELENVIHQLDLPSVHTQALTDADLATPKGLEAAVSAGKALLSAMNSEIHPALLRLSAVQEQRKRFEKYKAKFSQTISRHLNNLFIHLGNDVGENLSFHANDLTLPKHNSVHRELIVYSELMHWSKSMDRKAYAALTKVYTSSLSKLYDRDIRQFFEQARQSVSGVRDRKGKGSGSKEDLNLSTSMTNKLKLQPSSKQVQTPYGLLGVDKDQWGTNVESSDRQRYDSILERVLTELEPVCLSEQRFCVTFFQLDVLNPSSKNTQTTLDHISPDNLDENDTALVSPNAFPQKKIDRQINEEVRKMMGDLFTCLEPELVNFISYYEKMDSFSSLYILVRLSQHVMAAQDTGSFLSMTFGSALVQVKRSFDRFMQAQHKSIEEAKVNKRSKCGILPYVENFEEFAMTAESIFRNTERRTDLDKWYTRLVGAMFDAISIHSMEHFKTPHQVVKMENFHHLFALLSQLKISVLDGLRKEAKTRYSDALKAYVTSYFGRPLEKLNLFFEGVQVKVSQGVKEAEISYQMAFSKQELRKVINQYPAREVKKGLESLYKKVERHLCEEENLLQVVWRAMQEEFITQYKSLEEYMQNCYPGSMIALDFSIDDLLQFFSEIARSH